MLAEYRAGIKHALGGVAVSMSDCVQCEVSNELIKTRSNPAPALFK